MKKYSFFASIFLLIFIVCLNKSSNKNIPIPTEFIQKKIDRKIVKDGRKKWILDMHRSHPDIDWKALRKSGDPVLFLFDDAMKYYTAETDLYSLEYQKANKAQYYILKGRFLANTADSLGYHKAIDMVKLGLEAALELDQKDKIIEASTFLGKFYYEIKDFAESMQNYNNALAEIEKIRVKSPEEYKSSYLDNV